MNSLLVAESSDYQDNADTCRQGSPGDDDRLLWKRKQQEEDLKLI
jgi:hypothetical protein